MTTPSILKSIVARFTNNLSTNKKTPTASLISDMEKQLKTISKYENYQKLILALGMLDQVIKLKQQIGKIMIELDELTAQVSASDDVEASAVVLISGIAARIAAAGVDPAKLKALTSSLKAESDQLAAAVAENTPADPSGPPVTPTVPVQ